MGKDETAAYEHDSNSQPVCEPVPVPKGRGSTALLDLIVLSHCNLLFAWRIERLALYP
jgi:hypothetical protein